MHYHRLGRIATLSLSTKTNYTVFYPVASQSELDLKIGDTTLAQNTKAKLLGLYIENNLKHQQTITNIIKKLQPVIQNLRFASNYVPPSTMKQLYYSHVYPHLIGSLTVWGTEDTQKTYMQPLIRTHTKILRIIKHLPPRTHTKPIMNELHILNLNNLYILRVAVEMHPFVHPATQQNRPEHNHDYLWTAQIHEYPTRHSLQQHHYIPNRSYKQTPSHTMEHLTKRYSKIWNSLPAELRNNPNFLDFKTKLRTHLLETQEQ